MFIPFGEVPIVEISASKSANKYGAKEDVAPCAQSKAICKPEKSSSTVCLMYCKYFVRLQNNHSLVQG